MYGGGHDGPRGPPRAGIGAQGAAQNPIIANLGEASPTDGPDGGSASPGPSFAASNPPSNEKYSLFLSGIPPSLDDRWLHEILESVGPFIKVNRIRDASGKPKGFGFVEYGDAETVLRCLSLINGVTLVGRDGDSKALTVKADAKVRERLDVHEASRMADSQLDDQAAVAKATLEEVLAKMKASVGQREARDDDDERNPDGSRKYKVPAHLQDLAPDELPEESRGLITREIAFFREQAAKREEANRMAEQKRNQSRRDDEARRYPAGQPSTTDPRSARMDQGSPRFPDVPNGPRSSYDASPSSSSASQVRRDQGPSGFVPSSTPYSSSSSSRRHELTDEEAERLRVQRKREQMDQEYRARLASWEKRERGRLGTYNQERKERLHETQAAERRYKEMSEKCANFNDDEEAERGSELFIVDRARWRKYRAAARRREIEQDERDAELEAQQAEALKKESEDFLNRQAELFASMKGTTMFAESSASGEPKKLKLAAMGDDYSRTKSKAPAVFAGDEEEDTNKKKRELIPLSYSDDEDDDTKAEKKKRKAKDLVDAIPNDKQGLWAYETQWGKVTEPMLHDKLRPFVAKKSVEFLGSEEDEVIDTVLENIRAHKGPADLADELEPVLAEEADDFVIKVYRMLHFEILSAVHGLKL